MAFLHFVLQLATALPPPQKLRRWLCLYLPVLPGTFRSSPPKKKLESAQGRLPRTVTDLLSQTDDHFAAFEFPTRHWCAPLTDHIVAGAVFPLPPLRLGCKQDSSNGVQTDQLSSPHRFFLSQAPHHPTCAAASAALPPGRERERGKEGMGKIHPREVACRFSLIDRFFCFAMLCGTGSRRKEKRAGI